MPSPLKIVLLDRSRVFRNALALYLGKYESIQIRASLRDAYKAMEIIIKEDIDILIMDLDLPDISGLEFIKQVQLLKEKNKKKILPDILITDRETGSSKSLERESLAAGALAYISKPLDLSSELSFKLLTRTLMAKIESRNKIRESRDGKIINPASSTNNIEALLIGLSTGGPRVLHKLLPQIRSFSKLPILIVQHMPPGFTRSLADSLSSQGNQPVFEAEDKMEIKSSVTYIAPGGKHMMIEKKEGRARIKLSDEPPENGYRPSVDILFYSAAQVWKNKILALVLTGMGRDGTQGAASLKSQGATIFVQDKDSSLIWGMPGSIVKAGLADLEVSLDNMAKTIEDFLPARLKI